LLFEQQLYTYDNNGNQLLTTRTTYTDGIPGTPVVTQQNTYDLRNQLIRTVTENGTIVDNVYNGDGLRVEKIVNGSSTRYLYEYQRVVLEKNSLGDVTGRNVYGTNLLMRTVGADAFFYMYNAHADVTALLSTSGTIIATYYYDAFGNVLEQTGSARNNILFAGYQYDTETGMYYLNARMYDPVTARFMQEDTYTGQNNDPLSLNLYTYCHNEPLMYSDPTGHNENEDEDDDDDDDDETMYYEYHGQYLSGDTGNDNPAQIEQRKAMLIEYPGEHVANAAEAAMVSAGKSGNKFKAPTSVNKIVTAKAREKAANDAFLEESRTKRRDMEESIKEANDGIFRRAHKVVEQALDSINKGIEGTGNAIGKSAYAYVDTFCSLIDYASGDISWKELSAIAKENDKTLRSIQVGKWDGAFDMAQGAQSSMYGTAEYILLGTNYINNYHGEIFAEQDDFLVDFLDLNREDFDDAKGIAPTVLLLTSLINEWANVRAQNMISKANVADDPASLARDWQGKGGYSGVDDWSNIQLKKGEVVWGGEPGQSNFYTTDSVMNTVGNDATQVYNGLQVGKGNYPQFRPGMTQFEVTQDIIVGYSKALANPQFGIGGFDQFFITNYESVLKPVMTKMMQNR
jgi:RHS repeat-associated protein